MRSGRMALADRYIYTLMARDLVRGMDEKCENLYGIALEPMRCSISMFLQKAD